MLGIAFAGFRHGHIYSLYNEVNNNENTKLCGAWENDDAARAEAAANNGVEFTYSTYAELLADKNVDIVAIGDYFGARGKLIIEALKAGKNVITDKPICTSIDELDEIERLVKETGLKVGCMLDLRHCKFADTLKKLYKNGSLGEINTISFTGQHPLNYGTRAGWYFEEGKHGGTINDISVHGIDLIAAVFGLRVKNVCSAREWNKYASKVPYFMDSAMFMVELDNGAHVMSDVTYAVPDGHGFALPQYWRFTIWGTKGMVEFNLYGDDMMVALKGDPVVKRILCEESTETNLKDFIRELAGEECEYNTEFTLRSARDVLTIQKAAE